MILLCACFPVALLILVFVRCCLLISFLLSRSPFFPPFRPLPRPYFSRTWSNSLLHDLTSLALSRLYDFAFPRSFHLFHSFPFCALSTCSRFDFLALPTGSTILSFSTFAVNSKCRPSILYWIHWDRKKNLYLLTAGALKKTRMLWSGALGKDKNRFIFSARFAAALALSACSASSQHRARLRKITRSKKLKRLWWTNVFPCPRFPSVFQALQLSMKTHAPKAQILIITIF